MMTLPQALDAITRGETEEQYKKRISKIRRYANERDDLEASIDVLEGDTDPECKKRCEKKKARLKKVLACIEKLR